MIRKPVGIIEGFITDLGHAIAAANRCQQAATTEGLLTDTRHACRDSD